MIPRETIEQIRQASDIVQIVGEYIRLKKRGRDMWAPCPFHTEKTPSFKVSADRQLYHCFGCGKGGNVITFLMEHEKMSFVEAVRHLARKANIPIRETGSDYRREFTERLNYAHQVAQEYYHKLLFESKYQAVLEDYLKDKRGITTETIKFFQLGLCGESWDGLLKHALKKDLKPEELHKAGLLSKSERKGTFFDRFRQRLMFPIFNLSQKPIAFGGRTLKKGEPAKYVNSPETPLYNKSYVLYGLNFARDHIRKAGSAIVVEGYFDLISLWQVGIKNVVASSGTAFTQQQARLLARFTEEVSLFFDADSAGHQAALRSVECLFNAGLEVKVMVAPSGEDPDSVARKHGSEQIMELQKQALDYIHFRVLDSQIEEAGAVEHEVLVKELAVLAGKISNPTRRRLFAERASSRLQVNEHTFLIASGGPVPPEGATDRSSLQLNRHEFELLSLLLHSPGVIDRAFESITPDDFSSKQLSRVYAAMLSQYQKSGTLDTHHLIENLREQELVSLVTELASFDWTADSINTEAVVLIDSFTERRLKPHRIELRRRLAAAEAGGDQKRANEILKKLRESGLEDA